ncbi:hypothetical protein [Streptomyces zagrosensis]|uniref:Uncharacterized protein n=1 Tax=Streptomyces zagrosensis TaxID=1042984 RepID=A0A7W9UWV6_9ACTN|nr:hypothetical protein [Streptomyces zagrosensis]MBB5934320.1 hypothetical protein [Streptomyces zagrosensis]
MTLAGDDFGTPQTHPHCATCRELARRRQRARAGRNPVAYADARTALREHLRSHR